MMKCFFKKMALVTTLAIVVSLAAPTAAVNAATVSGVALQGTKTVVTEYELEKAGDTVDFCFLGAPSDWWGTYQWTTSNPEVATVDKSGIVTAVSTGTATITITAGADASYVHSVTVTVYNMELTAGNSRNKAMEVVELKKGKTLDLNFYGVTDWSSRKSAYLTEWVSSNTDVVSVNETNGVITAKAAGSAVVIFYLYDMEKDVLFSSAPVTIVVAE